MSVDYIENYAERAAEAKEREAIKNYDKGWQDADDGWKDALRRLYKYMDGSYDLHRQEILDEIDSLILIGTTYREEQETDRPEMLN